MIPLILTSNVLSLEKVRSTLPRTLRSGSFIALQNHSHHPSLYGEWSVINFSLIPCDENFDLI